MTYFIISCSLFLIFCGCRLKLKDIKNVLIRKTLHVTPTKDIKEVLESTIKNHIEKI